MKTKLPNYISEYEVDGKTFYRVYIFLRSKKFKSINAQKRITKIPNLKSALKEKDKWLPTVAYQLKEKESEGAKWKRFVEAWELYWKKYPSRRFGEDRLRDHISRAVNWTSHIWEKPASKVTIGDCRLIIKQAFEKGATKNLRKEIKGTLNAIFEWAMQEGYLPEMRISPAKNIDILCPGEVVAEEDRQEILNHGQISKLLESAEKNQHPWYPVWLTGFHSGLRTSELEALRKENLELVPSKIARELDKLPDGHPKKNYGFIHVRWAWKTKLKEYGKPKAHYWRSVPVNQELYWFLIDYVKTDFGSDEIGSRLYPELPYWKRGEQAKVLRLFCESNNLFPPELDGEKWGIKFHTIRACFATQLLALGIPENKVMKIGGWRDVETMRIYIRLAGILENGSTQGLKFRDLDAVFDPSSPYNNVDYRKANELPDDGEDEEDDGPDEELEVATDSPSQIPASSENVIDFAAFQRRQNA